VIQELLKKWTDIEKIDHKIVLGLLMFKKINDTWKLEFEKAYNELIKLGLSEEEAKREAQKKEWHNDIDIPEECLWENIRKETERLPEKLSSAMKELARRNPDLKDIFEGLDSIISSVISSERIDGSRKIRDLFEEISGIDTTKIDFPKLIDYIIVEYSLRKAKQGGIYTPKEIITLILNILEPKSGDSIYDPSSSYGEFLIATYKYAKDVNIIVSLYGEEIKDEQYFISKINLMLNGVIDFKLEKSNSLLNPAFKENGTFKKFDIGVSNPQWNMRGYGEETLRKGEFWRERFKYGFPPRQSADWAWIQHLLASTKENGKAAIVIDNNCLSRMKREKSIRARIVEEDLIEAVILLPEKLFYNANAQGIIMIFNKNKPPERKGKILLIDASNEYEKHPTVKKLNILSPSNIKKIVEVYRNFKDVPKFARVVEFSEIKNNDFNLSPSSYITQFEEEQIDTDKEFNELKKIIEEDKKLENRIEEYVSNALEVIK
jgi:type I restriction enzyme M protein